MRNLCTVTTRVLIASLILVASPGFLSCALADDPAFLGSCLWSGVMRLTVVDDLAYGSYANGLIILDVTDPDHPAFLSRIYCGGGGFGEIEVAQGYAYLADGHAGLQVIDVHDPEHPAIVGNYHEEGSITQVDVEGNLAFLTNTQTGGVTILDISQPTSPQPVYSFPPSSGGGGDVFAAEDLAYIARGEFGFAIYDVTNPAAPIEVGGYSPMSYAWAIVVADGYAYLLDHSGGGKDDEESHLVIFDVSDPSQPTYVTTFEDPLFGMSLTIEAGRAYLGDGSQASDGMVIVDVSDPAHPARLGEAPWLAAPHGICIQAGLAYTALGHMGLAVVDVMDPANPSPRSTWYEAKVPLDCALLLEPDGVIAYVSDYSYGLRIMDLSVPETPMPLGECALPGTPMGLVRFGAYVMVACGDAGLQVIDVTDLEEPHLAGAASGDCLDVIESGGLLYAAAGHDGLRVFDPLDPTCPREIGRCQVPGRVHGLCVAGGYAYLGAGTGGLQIVEVSEPESPVLRGGYDEFYSSFSHVAVAEDYAFLPSGNYGLKVFDVSDPANPTLRVDHDMSGSQHDIQLAGTLAYLTGGYYGGLQVVDVSDPLAPVTLGGCLTPGQARHVSLAGSYAVVGDGSSIMIFSVSSSALEPPSPPARVETIVLRAASPARDVARLLLTTREPMAARVELLDVSGRLRAVLFDGALPAGATSLTGNFRPVSSGAYFLRVHTPFGEASRPVTVIR
jgi:hypothetical protein